MQVCVCGQPSSVWALIYCIDHKIYGSDSKSNIWYCMQKETNWILPFKMNMNSVCKVCQSIYKFPYFFPTICYQTK